MEAIDVLDPWIMPNDELYCLAPSYVWWALGDTVNLDGDFTVEQLEAIAWWMRNKTTDPNP